jgi:predicted MPP superfamily phosphohydrolase
MEGVDPTWLAKFILRNIPDVMAFSGVLLVQILGTSWILRGPAAGASRRVRVAIVAAALASSAAVCLGFLLGFARFARHVPAWWLGWGRGLIITWSMTSVLLVFAYAATHLLPKPRPEHSPARRNFLRAAQIALFAAPAATVGYGVFIGRFNLKLREQSIFIPGLHPDLDGLRLVQLTDIHMSPFLSEREVERAVAMANETRAHVALVTGDLISFQGDPLDACLRQLARLTSESGIYGCLGNHEIYAGTEDYTTEQGARMGMQFLRGTAATLRFGNATLNIAGVDYQHFRHPYLLGAEKLLQPGAMNLLLSHNPDVFPVAARQGWQCTLAGHTHGGQVRVEILRQDLNIARFFTPYVDGLYREGPSSIFVSRGIGTIGVPARIEAPPEVALLRLCRT